MFEGGVKGVQIKCKDCDASELLKIKSDFVYERMVFAGNVMNKIRMHWNDKNHANFEINLVG